MSALHCMLKSQDGPCLGQEAWHLAKAQAGLKQQLIKGLDIAPGAHKPCLRQMDGSSAMAAACLEKLLSAQEWFKQALHHAQIHTP